MIVFSEFISRFNDVILPVVGDIGKCNLDTGRQQGVYGDFINLDICPSSLVSKMLIEIGHVCARS